MKIIAKLHPIHIAVCAGLSGLAGMILLVVKAFLMKNHTPESTVINGVPTMVGPYSYDNNVIDGAAYCALILAVLLMVSAVIWKRVRM